MGSFKDEYVKMKPGAEKENFVYQNAIKQSKPKLVPITVPGPNNTKITYQVMPDFFMIDGIRISLSPYNAQRIADYFGMRIPTTKMADQIYRNSNPIAARLFSGTGAKIDGVMYTGQEFTQNLIGDSRANIAYSEQVDAQIAAARNLDPNKPIDGFAKYITQSDIPGRASLYGLWTNPNRQKTEKAIQGGSGLTPHGINQVEYCTFGRFTSPDVIITRPDGKKIRSTLDNVLNTANISSAITNSPGKGSQRYLVSRSGPPSGYRSIKLDGENAEEARAKIKSLLNRPLWSEIHFTISNGKTYIAKLEPKGISLYEPINQSTPTPTPTPTPTSQSKSYKKLSIMDRIREWIGV